MEEIKTSKLVIEDTLPGVVVVAVGDEVVEFVESKDNTEIW